MNRRWLRAGVCALALGLPACGESESEPVEPVSGMSPGELSAALDFVVAKVSAIHTDTRSGLPAEVASGVEAARARITAPLPEQELFFVLDEALAALHDAHTSLEIKDDALATYDVLPLPFTWLEEGLVVTEDAGALRRGDRIQSIAGKDERSWLADLRGAIPSENDAFLRGRAPAWIPREDFLRRFAAHDDAKPVVVEVERGGELRSVSLSPARPGPAPAAASPVSFTFDEASSLGVLRLDACVYDDAYDAALRSFMSEVAAKGIQKVAVDLRQNRGGNVLVAFAFLAYLKGAEQYRSFGVDMRVSKELLDQEPAFASSELKGLLEAFGVDPEGDDYLIPPEAMKVALGSALLTPVVDEALLFGGAVHVLTSARTFSSANLFATLIQDNALGQVVGEPTGNEIEFHGQNLSFDVPGTSFSLSVSSTRNQRPASDRPNQPSLTPDVLVPVTRQDIAEGRDAAITWLSAQ